MNPCRAGKKHDKPPASPPQIDTAAQKLAPEAASKVPERPSAASARRFKSFKQVSEETSIVELLPLSSATPKDTAMHELGLGLRLESTA